MSETESRRNGSEIISKLFRRYWTCRKIFVRCNNYPLKISGNFPCAGIKLFQTDVDEGW